MAMARLVKLVSLILLAFGGCVNPATPTSGPAPAGPVATGQVPSQFIYLVRIKITSIQVPVGTASGSEEIWSYLDEERTRAVHSATLGRNGLRVGIAGAATEPDLKRILVKMTGREIGELTVHALPGEPFPIEVRSNLPGQTIFTSYSDRTLSGADYPPGDNLLTLNVTLDENDPTRMIVTALPQIRTSQRETSIVKTEGKFGFIDQPRWFSFDPATFQFSLKDKEIVIIGPGAESRRPTSIGNHWLLSEKQGVVKETMLKMVMEVIKATPREAVPK